MLISIIIINYNTTDYLLSCLNSIIKETKDVEYEIIVVDNNSPDRKIEEFPQLYPTVNFQFRKVNYGFGDGCDYGVKISKGDYLYFMNPDIILKNNCLLFFLNYLVNHPDVAICSGILTDNIDNPIYTYNKFPGIYWETTEALLGNGENKINKLIKERKLDTNTEPFEVDW